MCSPQPLQSSKIAVTGTLRKGFPMEVTPTTALLVLGLLLIIATLEMTELVLAIIGAALYVLLQSPRQKKVAQQPQKGEKPAKAWQPRQPHLLGSADGSLAPRKPASSAPVRVPRKDSPPAQPKKEVRQVSSMPVAMPTFDASEWQGQVDELLSQILPTAQGDEAVQRISKLVEETVQALVPEAEVMGFASGDISRGLMNSVAVPEVDIIVSIAPVAIVKRLKTRLSKGTSCTDHLDMRKLQKSAIRACTDLLVAKGGFKFRRSAFRGDEPKVTLMAPASLGLAEVAIPIDFSVNIVTPLYNAALQEECGQIDKRSRALIVLVKRWAKDRGICHAAKGHLAPYAWSLLVIYFLQVRSENGGPMLPPLEGFKVASGIRAECAPATGTMKWQPNTVEASVATLFQEFIRFYVSEVNWKSEAVSVRLGKRAPPDLNLSYNILLREDGSSEVAPSIEDPFEPTRNLGATMTTSGLARMREEFARAVEIQTGSASLSELLTPWTPPDAEEAEEEDAKESPRPSDALARATRAARP